MNGAGLGRRNAAFGIGRRHVVEQPYLLPADAHSDTVEPSDRGGKGRGDLVVEIVERHPLDQAEAKAGKRHRLGRRKLLAGHHRICSGAIGHIAGQRPDRVEREA